MVSKYCKIWQSNFFPLFSAAKFDFDKFVSVLHEKRKFKFFLLLDIKMREKRKPFNSYPVFICKKF